jgi:hypothetical protein
MEVDDNGQNAKHYKLSLSFQMIHSDGSGTNDMLNDNFWLMLWRSLRKSESNGMEIDMCFG